MKKINPKNLAEAIYKVAEGKSGKDLGEVIQRSVRLLQARGMLSRSEEVIKALQDFFDKKSGVVRARITAAKKVSAAEKEKIGKELKERYRAEKVASEFFEDEKVLGGVKIEVEDEVLDTTYRNKLDKLEKFLIKEK